MSFPRSEVLQPLGSLSSVWGAAAASKTGPWGERGRALLIPYENDNCQPLSKMEGGSKSPEWCYNRHYVFAGAEFDNLATQMLYLEKESIRTVYSVEICNSSLIQQGNSALIHRNSLIVKKGDFFVSERSLSCDYPDS